MIAFSIFLVAFLALFWVATYSKYFQISISGNKKISSQEIENLTKNYLAQKAFIPKKNIIFLKKANLSQDLEKNFLIIKNTIIKKKLPNELQIKIEERPEYAVWCQNIQIAYQDSKSQQGEQSYSTSSNALIVSDQCFFSDEFGMIFQETSKRDFIIRSTIREKNRDFVISKIYLI